ncbi:MAG: hypothetical protein VX435_13960 [Planctomycetota bacterium]|nr:hypothetical protein [Planctomycetota bacterium]
MNSENRHPLFRVISCGVLIGTLLLVFSPCASAIEIDLERPGDREFVRDLAGLLDVPQVEHIKGLCDKLLTEKATPALSLPLNRWPDMVVKACALKRLQPCFLTNGVSVMRK